MEPYCGFQYHANSEIQTLTNGLCFRSGQSSKRTSRETEAHFNRVKRTRLSVAISRFPSNLFFSVFQGSLAVAIILIDGRKKPIVSWASNFRVRMLLKTAIKFATDSFELRVFTEVEWCSLFFYLSEKENKNFGRGDIGKKIQSLSLTASEQARH